MGTAPALSAIVIAGTAAALFLSSRPYEDNAAGSTEYTLAAPGDAQRAVGLGHRQLLNSGIHGWGP